MALLNKNSLTKTIDNVNEAFFWNNPISKREANQIIDWMLTRIDTDFSYRKGFGLTKQDIKEKTKTFTGETLTGASLRHIVSEEASRVVIQLSKIAGRKIPELAAANKGLVEG